MKIASLAPVAGLATMLLLGAAPAAAQTQPSPGAGWTAGPDAGRMSNSPLAGSVGAAPAPGRASSSRAATGVPQATVNDPTEGQNLSTRNGDHTITGTVSSPGASVSDIDRIEVWIDGERNTGTLLGTTTPQSD